MFDVLFFIENVAQKAATLRELTHKNPNFYWTPIHQNSFWNLVQGFKPDDHVTGLGAILMQGCDLTLSKPVVIACRKTSITEWRYPQLHLEATAVDVAFRWFQNYLAGAKEVKILTSHRSLMFNCSLFNMHRQGSIWTETIKLLNRR